MGRADQLRRIVRLAQDLQTLFGIRQEGVQQHRVIPFHDFLQRTQYVAIQMCIGHLFAP
ncbi:hypothetical protein D3C76_1816170 [compost metagenome]